MFPKNYFTLDCNFIWESDKKLEDFVYFRFDGEKPSDESSQDVKNDILVLKNASQGSTCVFKICPKAGSYYEIDAIDIICDAKHLEVYELNEAYLETTRGSRVDEILGFEKKTFMLTHNFSKPVTGCFLKLPMTTELCLYNMHITVIKSAEPSKSLSNHVQAGFNPFHQLISSLNISSGVLPNSQHLVKDKETKPPLSSFLSSILNGISLNPHSFPSTNHHSESTNIPQDVFPKSNPHDGLKEEQKKNDMDISLIEDSLKSHMNRLVLDLEGRIMSRLDKIEQLILGIRGDSM